MVRIIKEIVSETSSVLTQAYISNLFEKIDKQTAIDLHNLLHKYSNILYINKDILETRYDTIDILNKEFITKQEIKNLLKNVYDLERIVGRISYGNTNGKDLAQLKRSLSILPELKVCLLKLDNPHTEYLSESIDSLLEFNELLENAIVTDPPLTIKDGGIIKEGYNEVLDEIKNTSFTGFHGQLNVRCLGELRCTCASCIDKLVKTDLSTVC